MWRKPTAVLLGLVAGGIAVALLEGVSSAMWPLPEGVDPMDPANRAASSHFWAERANQA